MSGVRLVFVFYHININCYYHRCRRVSDKVPDRLLLLLSIKFLIIHLFYVRFRPADEK